VGWEPHWTRDTEPAFLEHTVYWGRQVDTDQVILRLARQRWLWKKAKCKMQLIRRKCRSELHHEEWDGLPWDPSHLKLREEWKVQPSIQ
jgi:hypothetical protein